MYPVAGARLVPEVLVEVVGDQLLSPSVSSALGLPRNLRLGQLDEQAAALMDPYTKIVLGREVTRCVRGRWAWIAGLEVLVSFGGMTVADLDLSTRTHNHLLRLDHAGMGNAEEEKPLRDVTVSELALIPGFGPDCLMEVLSVAKRAPPSQQREPVLTTASKTPPSPGDPRELRLAARSLAETPYSSSVSREDPRLGTMVRAVHRDARNAREAAELVLDGLPYRPRKQRRLLAAIDTLTRELRHLRDQPLDQELKGIVDGVIRSPRSRVAALARVGLGGSPPVTLQEAGQAVGLTRESVRQSEKRFYYMIGRALEAGGVWAPALDRALRATRQTGLITEEQLQARLARKGLIPENFSAGSLLAAAKMLGKPVDLYAEHGLISGRQLAVTPEQIWEIAARLVSYWGLTTIEDVRFLLTEETSLDVSARLITLMLETHENFSWLDRRDGWCWLYPNRQNRMLNQISKIMSVTPSISIEDLQDGIARHHHMRDLSAPRHVLARLCEDTGLYKEHDGRIYTKPGHPHWRETLGENEATIVEALIDQGPIMPFVDLQRVVVQEGGMNPHTLTLHLGSSPVLTRHAHALYGLRGTPPSVTRAAIRRPRAFSSSLSRRTSSQTTPNESHDSSRARLTSRSADAW